MRHLKTYLKPAFNTLMLYRQGKKQRSECGGLFVIFHLFLLFFVTFWPFPGLYKEWFLN
jgi:hypothetical protein